MLLFCHSSLVPSSTYFHKKLKIVWQKKSWIRLHKNASNLVKDLRTNCKIRTKNYINICIFSLLFTKTYLIFFNIFYSTSTITTNCNIGIISFCIFSLLFTETYLIFLNIFYSTSTITANCNIIIISFCIFSLLFTKTYLIFFNIFYSTSTITANCNIVTISSIKTEIIFSTLAIFI